MLGLPEKASWEEVKTCYKGLIKTWHPDQCINAEEQARCNQMTAKINAAYAVIRTYCNNYQFSFSDQEIRKYMSTEEWWFERFGNDPLWGPARKG